MAGKNSSQNGSQTYFGGFTQDQIARIIFEEFSKSGFQFNNFNAIVPSIINRMMSENGGAMGNYFMQMLIKGFMGNFNKK